jgi:hypothetical protein
MLRENDSISAVTGDDLFSVRCNNRFIERVDGAAIFGSGNRLRGD